MFRRVLKSFLTIAIATVLSVSQVPAFAAPAAPSAPFKPQMSAPTSSAQTEIVVTWLAPLDNAVAVTDYTIEYSSNAGAVWTQFADGIGTSTSTLITGLTAGSQYSVRVRAESAAGSSAWAIASAKAERFESVAAGEDFTCAVLIDGTVQCWGDNSSGQLGDGTLLNRPYVGYVSGITTAKSVSAGFAHACALLFNGEVWCWGSNSSGQLGNATIVDSKTPVKVLGLPAAAISVSTGNAHTCAVTTEAKAYCWGANGSGQLGLGDLVNRNQAGVAVSGLTAVTDVTAGASHTCAVKGAGLVDCWGANAAGQLGNGTTTPSTTPVSTGITSGSKVSVRGNTSCAVLASGSLDCWGENNFGQVGNQTTTNQNVPTSVFGVLSGSAVSVGSGFTCNRLNSGAVQCWGKNTSDQLGSAGANSSQPIAVVGVTAAVSVSAGGAHACAVLTNGTLECWGANNLGQLGKGTAETAATGRAAVTLAGLNSIDAGDSHTCGVKADGTIVCWGLNASGQLGNGDTNNPGMPVVVLGISDAISVSAGANHTCAVLAGGVVKCWGANNFGQLGNGTTTDSPSAVTVNVGSAAVAVSAGRNHTCAVLASGEARCWGLNSSGQLGRGDTSNSSTPVTVLPVSPSVDPALTGVVSIAVGSAHTCAVLTDKSVVCFGSNLSGQFGDGTEVSNSRATLSLATADSITAGDSHTCAVLAAAVHCWGLNASGQLGTGTTVSSSSPVAALTVTTARTVVAGPNHTCASLANGTALCWGNNGSGQLGDGSTTTRTEPVVAASAINLGTLAAGSAHTCALSSAGEVTCWGANTNGERGNASLSAVALALGKAPVAPTAVVGTSGTSSATVSWTPGANNGARVTSYTVTSLPAAGTCTATIGTSCTVTGLVNGRSYTFTVTATNAFGTSPASLPSAAVVPAGVPGAPTNVVGSPGNTTATITWLAPGDNGGTAVTGYTVSSSPASAGCTTIVGVGNATSCTVTGLTNTIAYTFTVTATNTVGASVSSAPSAAVTPLPFPDAPTAVFAVRGDLSATVHWTPPVNNSDAVQSFTVTSNPGNFTCTDIVGQGVENQCVVTGLTNGTAYTFTVISTNGSGNSAASAASTPVTPAGQPSPPVAIAAVRGNGSATVSWTPGNNNGSAIINYTVTSTDVGAFTCSTASTSCTVTGLTNGATYYFTVVATNSVTSSAASALSNAVTPATIPNQVSQPTATAGDSSAVVTWVAPNNNGEPLTSYIVTATPSLATCTVLADINGLLPTTCTFNGLTNGTPYYFTVRAYNLMGGALLTSLPSNSVTPAGVPFAPDFASAVRGDGSATVSWLAANDNGAAITTYTVTSTPGGKTCTTSGLSCVVTGLTNGVHYTFAVTSTNSVGTSAPSASTADVLVAGAPFVPTTVTTVDGDSSVTISWIAPNNNGEAITGYTVTASPGGATCSTVVGVDLLPTSCTITGLTNGSGYLFSVTATNAAGTSAASTGVAGTPVAAPDAPTAISATRGDGQVTVSWTAPVGNGGSALTGYLVTASPSGRTCTTVTTSCIVTGLTNGIGQRFSVQALNRAGASLASASSGIVTPAGKPLQPLITSLVPDYRQMTINWADNRSNGEAITATVVVASPGGGTCSATTETSCTITGLTNGARYTFVATATNALGDSIPSAATAETTVGAVPFAPTSVVGEAGDRKVTVRWQVADGRDFSVLSYKVTSTPGGFECTSETTTCIVTGLTNGVAYTFRVTAISIIGESLPSAPSVTQIPAGPPIAPEFVTVLRGSGQVEVRWTAADGNGSDVTGYSVLASPGGRSCVTTIALSCVISGLTNGTEYTFAVSATSIIGTSLPRVSEVVTPAGVSTAPLSVTAKAGNKAATVSWKKPASNGGEVITSYLVIASPGGARCVTESGSVTSCTLTGLTNGKAYTFSVIAVNSVGNSLPSTASTAVTPTAKPFAPTAVTPTSLRPGVVKLAWSGAKRNGATLIKYEYQFRLKSNQPWSAWKSVGTNTSVTLKSLTKGKAYQLKVRITTSVGEATSKVMPFTPTK